MQNLYTRWKLLLLFVICLSLIAPSYGDKKNSLEAEMLLANATKNFLTIQRPDLIPFSFQDVNPTELDPYIQILENAQTLSHAIVDSENPTQEDLDFLKKFSKISPKFRTRILTTIRWGSEFGQLTSIDLLRLIFNLKASKEAYLQKSQTLPTGFENQERDLQFLFHYDYSGNIFLESNLPPLGEGKTCRVSEGIDSRSWKKVALLLLHENPSERQKEIYQNDLKIGEILLKLPTSAREGLSETIAVGDGLIVQKKYQGNLFSLLHPAEESDQVSQPKSHPSYDLSLQERWQALHQLTQGLIRLKKLGIIHNDIKPDNILYQFYPTGTGGRSIQLVYSDWGLSYFPSELLFLAEDRPKGGNTLYQAPELDTPQWSSDSKIQDQVQAAYQSDVYSHSMIAYEIIHGKLLPAVHLCQQKYEKNILHTRAEYLKCRTQEVEKATQAYQKSPDLDLLQELLIRGLDLNPQNRIQIETFGQAVSLLSEKPISMPFSGDLLTLDEVKKTISKDKNFQTNCKDTSRLTEVGQYLICPICFLGETECRVQISYKNINKEITRKVLASDPTFWTSIRTELNFLKTVGVITNQSF